MVGPFDNPDPPNTGPPKAEHNQGFGLVKEALSEAKHLVLATQELQNQAKMARQTRNSSWMERIRGWARRLLAGARELLSRVFRALGDYIVKAIELGLIKIAIETCAMAISRLFEIVNAKGKKIEITTPGVYCNPAGISQASPPASQPTGNPFASYSSMQSASISPW